MKESKAYLKFFRTYFLYLFVPTCLGILLALYTYANTPKIYKASKVLEIEYDNSKLAEGTLLTDQAITYSLNTNVAALLSLQDVVKTETFKAGPLAMILNSYAHSADTARKNNDKIANFLKSKFSLSEIGEEVVTIEKPLFIKPLLYILFGGLIGLITALTKSYFSHY